MAPIITDPKKLSMPQQVQKNKDDIAEIKKLIDGLDSLDNVVIVPDISHIMTAEELKSVKQPVCFIIYDNHVYIKRKEESGYAYFDIVFSIVVTTVISFQSSSISVNLSNGALGISNSTVSTYSVTKIDELLALKTSYTYVDTELAKKANLTGANFTGGITAPSIIENMSGYRFEAQTSTRGTTTTLYAGMVKNGNKLTIVNAFIFRKNADATPGGVYAGRFVMPAEIAAKIIPFLGTTVANEEITAIGSSIFDRKSMLISFVKNDTVSLTSSIADVNSLDAEKDYYMRHELTVLLSDSLAS